MTSPLVLGRIEAWEAAGLIDSATASRLRDAEADAPVPAEPQPHTDPRGPGVAAHSRGPGLTAVELFSYLGAAFVLGAWYALVGSVIPDNARSGTWHGVAAVIVAGALAVTAIVLAPRDPRSRRAAGVALAVALPNLGVGLYPLAGEAHPEVYGDVLNNLLVASTVVLAAAVAARRFLPAVLTQLALAISAAELGQAALAWLDPVVFPRPMVGYEMGALDVTTALIRVGLTLAWWWTVALAMVVLLLVAREPRPKTEGQVLLGRVAVGLTVVAFGVRRLGRRLRPDMPGTLPG